MDMVQTTILAGIIDDNLWPEMVLGITHVKNLWPTQALKDLMSLIEIQDQAPPTLQYLWILGLNVYIFLHKEKQSVKLVKWEARALKRKLVSLDGYIIYKVHIKDQNKVIQVKDLQIYKDITFKVITFHLNFDKKPTFNEIQIPDEQTPFDKSSNSKEEKNTQKQSS